MNCGTCEDLGMIPSDDPDGDVMNTPCPECNKPDLPRWKPKHFGNTNGYECPECEELKDLFDLRRKADQRAIEIWQKHHPEKKNVWPDHTDMVVWLLEQFDAISEREILDPQPHLEGRKDD